MLIGDAFLSLWLVELTTKDRFYSDVFLLLFSCPELPTKRYGRVKSFVALHCELGKCLKADCVNEKGMSICVLDQQLLNLTRNVPSAALQANRVIRCALTVEPNFLQVLPCQALRVPLAPREYRVRRKLLPLPVSRVLLRPRASKLFASSISSFTRRTADPDLAPLGRGLLVFGSCFKKNLRVVRKV